MADLWVTAGVSLVSLVVGGFLGNWLAIGRDRRKERNEARLPIWMAIDNAKPSKASGLLHRSKLPKNDDIQVYRARVSRREYAHFEKLLTDLNNLMDQHGSPEMFGNWSFPQDRHEELGNTLRLLLHHTRQR